MVYTQSGTIPNNRDLVNSARLGKGSPYTTHSCCIEKDGKRWLMRNNDQRRLARVNCTQLNADSIPANLLVANDQYFDIQVTGAPVHTLEWIVLHTVVTNTDAAIDGIPMLPFWFFNRVECMANGGFADDIIYPIQWYLDFLGTLTPEQKTMLSWAMGMEAKNSASLTAASTEWTIYDEYTNALSPLESKNYYIPFNNNFLVQANAWLKSKSVNPKFRFYCSVNPVCSDTNAPNPIPASMLLMTSAEFIVGGIIFNPDIAERINKYYMSGVTLSRVMLHERQIFDLTSWSPGVESSDQSLTGFNGEFSAMWFYVSRGEASREQLYASNRTATAATVGWLPLQRVSLKDSSGNPVMFLNMGAELLKNVFPAKQYPHLMLGAYKDIFYFPFSMCGAQEDKDGIASGGIQFDAKFQLQITPQAYTVGATTSWKNTVCAKRIGLLCLTDKGEFKITKL